MKDRIELKKAETDVILVKCRIILHVTAASIHLPPKPTLTVTGNVPGLGRVLSFPVPALEPHQHQILRIRNFLTVKGRRRTKGTTFGQA